MPVLLAILAAVGAAAYWIIRMRGAADAVRDIADVAGDVAGAARRFGFRRRANKHPVDCIDDGNTAIAATAAAFLSLGDTPSKEENAALIVALAKHLKISGDDAAGLTTLGAWLVGQCSTPAMALTRCARQSFRIDGAMAFEPLMAVIADVAATGDGLSVQQKESLLDIKSAYKL